VSRLVAFAAAAILTGCGPSAPLNTATPDPTKEPWYEQTTDQLAKLNREAEGFFQKKQFDPAAALIEQGKPLADRLVSVQHPTLAAAEAASDLDDLYGRMLLANRHYGWARLLFQKNQARWKNWQPQTQETARRLKQAEMAIAECDREIEK